MKVALSIVLLGALGASGWLGVRYFADDAEAEAANAEAEAPEAAPDGDIAPLAAEMDALTQRLADAEAVADSLRRLLDQQSAAAESARADAGELATTLTKMEDDELSGVVQRLDGRSFVQLYEAASARNQVRLLGALTSEQAAAFIRHQLPGGPARARASADTTSQ